MYANLPIYLSALSLSLSLSLSLPIYLPLCRPIYLPVYLHICMHAYLLACLLACLCARQAGASITTELPRCCWLSNVRVNTGTSQSQFFSLGLTRVGIKSWQPCTHVSICGCCIRCGNVLSGNTDCGSPPVSVYGSVVRAPHPTHPSHPTSQHYRYVTCVSMFLIILGMGMFQVLTTPDNI